MSFTIRQGMEGAGCRTEACFVLCSGSPDFLCEALCEAILEVDEVRTECFFFPGRVVRQEQELFLFCILGDCDVCSSTL